MGKWFMGAAHGSWGRAGEPGVFMVNLNGRGRREVRSWQAAESAALLVKESNHEHAALLISVVILLTSAACAPAVPPTAALTSTPRVRPPL